MKRTLTVVALLLGLPLSAAACLWDRDTPASEAKGMPEVVAVLTGRFERNPPLFYEMRLARVSARLNDHPEDLGAYDDAGVACDRLGRGDEAVGWMTKKRSRLDALDKAEPAVKEHLYRYHANLGTFLVHRWSRQGADRSRIDEVKAARDEIAAALKINPNAHFGREIYQLKVLEWVIDPPKQENSWEGLPNPLGWSFDDTYGQSTEPKEADDAVRGLAGLVVLGNAWESVDIFNALNVALQRDSLGYPRSREGGRNTLAAFAWLRSLELVDAGKGSMLPDAPKGDALKALLRRPDFIEAGRFIDPPFRALRDDADTWHKARTAFMTERLNQGRHPDTDPSFWNGYTERPAPLLPTKSVPDTYREWQAYRVKQTLAVFIGVPLLVVATAIGWVVTRRMKARRHKLIADPLD